MIKSVNRWEDMARTEEWKKKCCGQKGGNEDLGRSGNVVDRDSKYGVWQDRKGFERAIVVCIFPGVKAYLVWLCMLCSAFDCGGSTPPPWSWDFHTPSERTAWNTTKPYTRRIWLFRILNQSTISSRICFLFSIICDTWAVLLRPRYNSQNWGNEKKQSASVVTLPTCWFLALWPPPRLLMDCVYTAEYIHLFTCSWNFSIFFVHVFIHVSELALDMMLDVRTRPMIDWQTSSAAAERRTDGLELFFVSCSGVMIVFGAW